LQAPTWSGQAFASAARRLTSPLPLAGRSPARTFERTSDAMNPAARVVRIANASRGANRETG